MHHIKTNVELTAREINHSREIAHSHISLASAFIFVFAMFE